MTFNIFHSASRQSAPGTPGSSLAAFPKPGWSPALLGSVARLALFLGGLALSVPRGRAESGVSYKYQDYAEGGGRIAVHTQSALLEQDLGTDTHVKVEGVIDAIAGATPDGQPAPAGSDQVSLSQLHERRKAWNADLSHQFSRVNVTVGIANSRESDYVSDGWSVNTLTDFNQKNTTLLLGVAGTDDDVKVFFQSPWLKKRTNDVIVGVTQLLDPRTSVSFNVSWGRATGFLSDPYKLVLKNTEVLPGIFLPITAGENRPDERNKGTALLSLNHAVENLHGAVQASYRYYHDTFGTAAHTLELAWFQHLGEHVILRPAVRFYDQSAADFYYYRLDGTSITPARLPTGRGTFYSSDFRLSAMRTYTYGLKAIWTPKEWLQLDASYDRYEMHGRDGVTPKSAYVNANIVTGGIRFLW
jgi:hypothetical protein